MKGLEADSLSVDCLKEKPRDQDWYLSGGMEESWEVIQPFAFDDFIEPVPDNWAVNEEKTGYSSYDSMEEQNQPMMNYYYPLYHMDSFDEEDAKKISHLPLCIVHFIDSDEYALALTGGGMDLSWPICEAFIRLGYYPPVHFRLPRMAGKRASPRNLAIVEACIKGREIVGRWADSDVADLERTRDFLSPLEPIGEEMKK